MPWPSRAEYTEAVRDYFHISLQDPELQGGRVRVGQDNFVLSYAGGFSIVFPIDVGSRSFALRCWTQSVDNAQVRYQTVSDYLRQTDLPWFIDFKYEPEGIMVMGNRYPVTRMAWVDGETLRDFIGENLQTPNIFRTVADEFQKMVETLHDHQISHGDLQDGNILIKQNGNAIEIKLIDYDSLLVPALHGQTEQIVGLPEYQHPQRTAGNGRANEKVDYFSELVIYLSFLGLSENPDLWNQFADENRVDRGLLFSKEDFANPDQSDVFQELANLSPDVQQLAATLKDFCAETSIDQLKPLEDILPRSDANTHCNRGDFFSNDGRYAEALAEFQRAIDREPDYARAYFGRGHVYRRTGHYANAITEFQQAINFNPNYTEAHYGLALAYFESGDNSQAIEAANAALRIDPNYQLAHQLLDLIRSRETSSVLPTQPGPVSPPIQEPPTSNSNPPAPDSTSNPGTTTPDSLPPTPKPKPNVWKYLTPLLGIVLVFCGMTLVGQIQLKNAALRQVKAKDLEIQQLSSDSQTQVDNLQTLEEEKQTLTSENEALKGQLAEKNAEIQRLTSRVQTLQPLTRGSGELAGMFLIPAGHFRMGSNEAAAYSDERPVHTVYVNSFYIDKYEVTNEEYKQFVDANPEWRKDRILRKYHDGNYLSHWTGNRYPYGKGNHPVTWVSWYAAMAYAKWKGKRLPTEAEWEKAAWGGLSSDNYVLNGLINSRTANYSSNVGGTTSVGNYQANPYGIYDMIGNVKEWCLDAYKRNFYANSPRRNPVAGGSIYSIVRSFNNLETDRVSRGGSWFSNINSARASYRFPISPNSTSNTTGFRCVKPANP